MLRLAVRDGSEVRHFELPIQEATLGSSADSELCAPFRGVSRSHARVCRHEGGVRIVDNGSKNGLVRDGQRLDEVVLGIGESVSLGDAVLTLEEISTGDGELAIAGTSRVAAGDGETASATTTRFDEAEGASPTSALAWARRHVRSSGHWTLAPRSLEEARRALGARSLVMLACPSGGDGKKPGVEGSSGSLPTAPELEDVCTRVAAAAGVPDETPVAVVRHDQGATLARAAMPVGDLLRVLVAFLPHKPQPWQLDFFDHVADVVLGGEPIVPAAKGDTALGALDFPPEFVIGESEAMRSLCTQIAATVRSHLDVLLLGETGTGKELFARTIHASGPTAKGPFVAINCAAIPAELLEAQLFGVEARVATGVDPRVGLFVKADGGSIFLDETGELPPQLQAKLLRVLQEREVLPVGAHVPRKIRLRVISASNRDLEREVRHGRFRADLYYRLRGLQFHLPPLRHRREDIPALVARFVAQSAAEHGKHLAGVSRKALDLLRAYDWPGNIRELRSEIDRAVLLAADGLTLTSDHFGGVRWNVERMGKESGEVAIARREATPAQPLAGGEIDNPYDLAAARDAVERRLIQEALAETGGNQSRAAKLLGVTRNGLALKAKRLGIRIGRG